MARLSRSRSATIIIVTCVCTSLLILYNIRGFRGKQVDRKEFKIAQGGTSVAQKRQRVAIASIFDYHHDVYMSFAGSLAQAMNRTSTGSVEVYAKVPFHYQFQIIVEELGLYRHEYRNPNDLFSALKVDSDNSIDMVVMGTCEVDLREARSKDLLKIWDARPQERKFQLVCIVHHVQDLVWQSSITEWSRRNAIRFITISEHVANSFRESFITLADSSDPIIRSAGYENILIDVHPPVLPLPGLRERPAIGTLSKAVIQGSFNIDRRDYDNVFKDLNASLHEDPGAWGYHPLGDHRSFLPNPDLSDPPFQLFTLGSGHLEVPIELQKVVQVKTGLTYSEFYDLMNQMDICVPAFTKNGYYHYQASSTFAMAVQCNVPILVNKRIRKSYLYADDDRLVVTRPAAMGEIAALKALRTGDPSAFLGSPMPNMEGTMGSNHLIRKAVEEMMQLGWRRTKEEFEAFKPELWKRNSQLADRMIRDL